MKGKSRIIYIVMIMNFVYLLTGCQTENSNISDLPSENSGYSATNDSHSSISDNEIYDLSKLDVPLLDKRVYWGMTIEEFEQYYPDEIQASKKIDTDYSDESWMITINEQMETDFGVCMQSTYRFVTEPTQSIGLYSLSFIYENTSIEEITQCIFDKYGEMRNATDEWDVEPDTYIPFRFYTPAIVRSLDDAHKEILRKVQEDYYAENLPDSGDIFPNHENGIDESMPIYSIMVSSDAADSTDVGVSITTAILAFFQNECD